VKTYVGAVEALRIKERGDETQFTTKIGGKASLGPSYFVLLNFIPGYTFDALLCQNWPFLPPNRLTLRITFLNSNTISDSRIVLVISVFATILLICCVRHWHT